MATRWQPAFAILSITLYNYAVRTPLGQLVAPLHQWRSHTKWNIIAVNVTQVCLYSISRSTSHVDIYPHGMCFLWRLSPFEYAPFDCFLLLKMLILMCLFWWLSFENAHPPPNKNRYAYTSGESHQKKNISIYCVRSCFHGFLLMYKHTKLISCGHATWDVLLLMAFSWCISIPVYCLEDSAMLAVGLCSWDKRKQQCTNWENS